TKDPSLYRYVGKPVKRIDIPGKVTGKVSYVQDLRLAGMVHGRICRPPSDHSDIKLRTFEPEAAQKLPGVIKIIRNGNFIGVIAEREEQAIAAAETLKQRL